jgi:hypothetical protein
MSLDRIGQMPAKVCMEERSLLKDPGARQELDQERDIRGPGRQEWLTPQPHAERLFIITAVVLVPTRLTRTRAHSSHPAQRRPAGIVVTPAPGQAMQTGDDTLANELLDPLTQCPRLRRTTEDRCGEFITCHAKLRGDRGDPQCGVLQEQRSWADHHLVGDGRAEHGRVVADLHPVADHGPGADVGTLAEGAVRRPARQIADPSRGCEGSPMETGEPAVISHSAMNTALTRSEAVSLSDAVRWLARYQDTWWVVYEAGRLRFTDELTVADIDDSATPDNNHRNKGGTMPRRSARTRGHPFGGCL